MISNFKISVQRGDDILKMNLEGSFNASAAQQLLYHMRMHCAIASVSSIVVDTSCLQNFEAFGPNILRYNRSWFKNSSAFLRQCLKSKINYTTRRNWVKIKN